MTRTHTFYFVDRIEELFAIERELREDWESRRPFIANDVANAGVCRLNLLREAITLLQERVAE